MSKVVILLVDDLHLEHRSVEMKEDFASKLMKKVNDVKKSLCIPILVCAGDIDEGVAGIEWVKQFDCKVVYTCGNHEFWNHDYFELIEAIQAKVKEPKFENINFLYNSSVVIEGVRFMGGSLWTEMGNSWAWWGNNKVIENFYTMADFRKIQAKKFYDNESDVKILRDLLTNNLVIKEKIEDLISKKLFNPLIQLRENRKTFNYLKSELGKTFIGKTVVVTHHLPIQELWIKTVGMDKNILSADSINNKDLYLDTEKKIPRAKNILMMGFYVNDYKDYFINRSISPDLWVHGHFHQAVDYYFGKTRIASSPVGHFKPEMESQNLKVKEIVIDDSFSQSMIKDFMLNRFKELDFVEIIKTLENFKNAIFSYDIAVNSGIMASSDFEPVLRVFSIEIANDLENIKSVVGDLLNSYININNLNMSVPYSKEFYILIRLSGLYKWLKNNNSAFLPLVPDYQVKNYSFDDLVDVTNSNKDELAKKWMENIDLFQQQLENFKTQLIEFTKQI